MHTQVLSAARSFPGLWLSVGREGPPATSPIDVPCSPAEIAAFVIPKATGSSTAVPTAPTTREDDEAPRDWVVRILPLLRRWAAKVSIVDPAAVGRVTERHHILSAHGAVLSTCMRLPPRQVSDVQWPSLAPVLISPVLGPPQPDSTSPSSPPSPEPAPLPTQPPAPSTTPPAQPPAALAAQSSTGSGSPALRGDPVSLRVVAVVAESTAGLAFARIALGLACERLAFVTRSGAMKRPGQQQQLPPHRQLAEQEEAERKEGASACLAALVLLRVLPPRVFVEGQARLV